MSLGDPMDRSDTECSLSARSAVTTASPVLAPRLVVGLRYLQHAYHLTEEDFVKAYVENPYW
jgi:hypothetical protein